MEFEPSMNNIASNSTLDASTGTIRKLASMLPVISQDGNLNETRIIIHETEPPTAHFQRNGLATPDCLPLPSMKTLAENRIPSQGINTPFSIPPNGPVMDLGQSFSQPLNCLPTLTLSTTSISTMNHLTGGSLDPFISHSKEALTTVSYSSKAQMSTGIQRSETLELPQRKSTIVPYLWERVVEEGLVLYISPTKVRLKSSDELKSYLLSDETCKCGLECPFHMDQVFSFDADTPSQPWKPTDLEQLRKVSLRPCCHSNHIRSHSLAASCSLLPKLTPPKRKVNKQAGKSGSRTNVEKSDKKSSMKNKNVKRLIKTELTPNKPEHSQTYGSHGQSSPGSLDDRPLPPVSSLTSLQPGLLSPTGRLQHDSILSPQQAIARLQDSNLLSPHHAGIPTSTLISPGGLLSPGRGPTANTGQPHPNPGLPPVGHLIRSHQNTHEELMMMGGMASQPGFYPPHPSYMRPITPHNDLIPLHRMSHNPNAPPAMPGYNMPDFMQSPGHMWAAPGYPAPPPHVGEFSHPPNMNMNPHLPPTFSGPVWHASQKLERPTPPRKRKRHRSSTSSTSNTGEQTGQLANQVPASQPHAAVSSGTPISVIKQTPDRSNSQSDSQDSKNNQLDQLMSPNNPSEPSVIRSNSLSNSQSTSQNKPSDTAPIVKEELRSPNNNTPRSDQATPLQLTSKSTPTSPPYAPLPSMQRMLYGAPPVFNHQPHPQQPPQLVRLPPMSMYYNTTQAVHEQVKDLTAKTSAQPVNVNGEKSSPASGSSNEHKNTPPEHFNPAQAMMPPGGGHFPGPNGQPHPGMFLHGMAPRPPFMMRGMDGQMYFRYTSPPAFETAGYPPMPMQMYPPGYGPNPMMNGHRMPTPPAPSPQKKRRKKIKDTPSEGEFSGLSNIASISSPAGSLKAEDLSMKGPNKPTLPSASEAMKAAAASVAASEHHAPPPAATCS